MTVSPASFASLLDALEVPKRRALYVQSSMDWVQRAGFDAREILRTLLEWTGGASVLAMPSYPYVGLHREYLEGAPVFDVRTAPSMTGLLAEMLRRTTGAVRSLDPDFCVSLVGNGALEIAGGVPDAPDPFGEQSVYRRLLDCHAIFLGLGVSTNTTSFIHVIDSQCAGRYPHAPCEDRLFDAFVIDRQGARHRVPRQALRPEFQQAIQPSAIIQRMQPSRAAFAAATIGEAQFFRWDLDLWTDWCVAHAIAATAAGAWPCWLQSLSAAHS